MTAGLLVTHDIDEAILLADRIVLMTDGPGATIGETLPVHLPRPRSRERAFESPDYYTLRTRIIKSLYGSMRPGAQAGDKRPFAA